MSSPITVAIERHVDPSRITEATIWTQAGTDSDLWYTLCRFADDASLQAWESSAERRWWLNSGHGLASESRVERRTGIEGWFDAPHATVVADGEPAVRTAPRRWKQAVSILIGFYPTNVVMTLLLTLIAPNVFTPPLPVRLLITTVLITPVMTYLVLPAVTRLLRPWLRSRPGR